MKDQLSRREMLKRTAGITAAGALLSTSSASAGPLDAAVVSVKDFGAIGDGSDSTAAFNSALNAVGVDVVYVPPGRYGLASLSIPADKKLCGDGEASRIVMVSPSTSCIVTVGQNNITLRDLRFEGDGTIASAAYFQECANLQIENVTIDNFSGHALQLDGCRHSGVRGASFYRCGDVAGHSALNLSNWSVAGDMNHVSDVIGENNGGRLVTLFGQFFCHVQNIQHKAKQGEALLMEDCQGCTGKMISQIGGNNATTGGFSDGVVLNAGCFNCQLSDIYCSENSGHGVSINGGSGGRPGASNNVISNVRVIAPDEGGVIVTDQGFAGSSPKANLIINCFVADASAATYTADRFPAFAVSGGTENQFVNCYAVDSRAETEKRTAYGYLEQDGLNSADANHFSGILSGIFVNNPPYAIAGSVSTIDLKASINQVV